MANETGKTLESASVEELSRGFTGTPEGDCTCLHCGRIFESGMVYEVEGGLALAARAAREHVLRDHGGAFEALMDAGPEAAGITEIQAQVLALLHAGRTDRDIAHELGGKSESTIRNHRFNLRKRAGEARLFLALMRALEEDMPSTDKDRFIEYPAALPTKDERALVTEAEAAAIETRCLDLSQPGRARVVFWPKKQKEKLVVLRRLAALFEPGRRYSEPEVNAILMLVYADHVTIRRYLIEYRFLDREPDGSAYWREP